MNKNKTYNICNIEILSTTLPELESSFKEILNSGNKSYLITTFNLDFLRNTTIDEQFYHICKNSFFNLPDGFGITHLIKRKYKIEISRITGNDIFPLLISLAKTTNKKVAIIGGTEKVSKLTEEKIIQEYNFLSKDILCLSPPYKFENDKNTSKIIVDSISNFNPDILFAALGSPRQEKWLSNNMRVFNSKINIGIGATLDFFVAEKKRSPVILQQIGLEWLWRLLAEPKRLSKRYLINDLPFFIKLLVTKNY